MDDFDYLQENALTKWLDRFLNTAGFGENTPNRSISKWIEDEFLPRFESQLYQNLASKSLSAANEATKHLRPTNTADYIDSDEAVSLFN